MRRFLLILLISVQPLFAAMSDAAARKKAFDLWGPNGTIGQIRVYPDNNWTKYVGIETKNCRSAAVNQTNNLKGLEFLVLGKGFNTWDAAFDDASMNPIAVSGPFAGTIHLRATAWDNVAPTLFQWIIDGVMQNPPMTMPTILQSSQQWLIQTDLPTGAMPDGMHFICAKAVDGAGNIRITDPQLFRTLQSTGSINADWYPFQLAGQIDPSKPSVTRITVEQ